MCGFSRAPGALPQMNRVSARVSAPQPHRVSHRGLLSCPQLGALGRPWFCAPMLTVSPSELPPWCGPCLVPHPPGTPVSSRSQAAGCPMTTAFWGPRKSRKFGPLFQGCSDILSSCLCPRARVVTSLRFPSIWGFRAGWSQLVLVHCHWK